MLGTSSGISLFNPATAAFIETPEILASNPDLDRAYIHFIREIRPLQYLIGTADDGIFLYDALRQTLRQDPPEYVEPLVSREPMSCYVDRQDNIWIGTFDKGFSVINPERNIFNLDYDLDRTFKDVFSTRIIEDEHHNLWVGTRYRGLWFYGSDRTVRRYDSSNSPAFRKGNLVEEIFIDSRHRLWIAGAEQISVAAYDSEGDITLLHTIPHRGIGSATITEDRNGNIWFGLTSGLFLLRNGSVSGSLEKMYSGNISKVYPLSDGRLLFSVYGNGIYVMDSQAETVSAMKMPSKETSAISRHCVDIFEDSRQRLWFGSFNEGVMYVKGPEYRTFSMSDGLPSNDITCIRQDRSGDIWFSSSYGLSRVNRDMTVTNFFEKDGTRGNIFQEKASLLRSDGILFFTGSHGLTFFDPMLLTGEGRPSPVVIEDLKIKNMMAAPKPKYDEAGKPLPSGRSAKAGLHKAIQFEGMWGRTLTYAQYKALRHGKLVVAAYSSQQCPKCGHTHRSNRPDQAHFACTNPDCRFNEDHQLSADQVAAMNIASRAVQQIFDDQQKSKERKRLLRMRKKGESSEGQGRGGTPRTVMRSGDVGAAKPVEPMPDTGNLPVSTLAVKPESLDKRVALAGECSSTSL